MNRSETVTVRLDPRLNYLCELAARAQRRTKSSFIEWAVEAALGGVTVPGTGEWNKDDLSIDRLAAQLWDVDEADRLVALAFSAPILMTHEEQLIWKQIKEYGHIWKGKWISSTEHWGKQEWSWETDRQWNLVMDRLRAEFDQLRKVALGEAHPATLKHIQMLRDTPAGEDKGGFADDLSDDIPF